MKWACLIVWILITCAHAHDLSIKYSKEINPAHQAVLDRALTEVSTLLPEKFKRGLPKDIEIKIAVLSAHKSIPENVCSVAPSSEDGKLIKKNPFVYATYNYGKNTLTLNLPVFIELKKGKESSKEISCQHKTLYEQSIATLIHELTHAYDLNNKRISSSVEFMRRAGFKKGLLKVKNKNVEAMRSMDAYELFNVGESFAVNMEYFTMDAEFMCRRPSMFEYYKNLFEMDTFPNRNCSPSSMVMMSTPSGYVPTDLDVKRVYRIDYLMAAAGQDAMSGFGHSMFRIVMCAPEHVDFSTRRKIPATPFGEKCLEDRLYHLVVSYRANVEDAHLSYMKGIFGGYPSMLFILSFGDVLSEYNDDELRDVVAYPLKLSNKERVDFITKVKEEHWNYRGDYKFITNNCAVESYDLLKAALEKDQLEKKSSVTPKGVLEDLDEFEILSRKGKDIERFKANTQSILLAYSKAYGYKIKKDDKENKKAIASFIESSTFEKRNKTYETFLNTEVPGSELNTEVSLLKERLAVAASFSIIEQQIKRALSLKYRKMVAEKFSDKKDEKLEALIKEAKLSGIHLFKDLAKNGYGIPFIDEVSTHEELLQEAQAKKGVQEKIEQYIKSVMKEEFKNVETLEKNIAFYNAQSLKMRKVYRKKLDQYVQQVLVNLSKEAFTKEILIQAASGDVESLGKVRDFLGADLVSKKEILDIKLQQLIQELLL